jgi:hypothetical protein
MDDLANFILPTLLYFVLIEPNINQRIEPMDEGLRLSAANQILHRKKPYTDIYFQYGPGSEVVQPLLAFSLFGQSLAGQRQLERILGPLGKVGTYILCVVVLGGHPLLLFIPFVILGTEYCWMIYPRVFFPLLTLALVISSRETKDYWFRSLKLLIAGGFTVLGFLYSMEGGLLTAPAIGLFYAFLWFDQFKTTKQPFNPILKDASWFLIGVLTIMTPFFLWLVKIKGVSHFYKDTFLVGSTLLSAWGKPTPLLCQPLLSIIKNPFVLFSFTGIWAGGGFH